MKLLAALFAFLFALPALAACDTDLFSWQSYVILRVDCGQTPIRQATLFANGTGASTITLPASANTSLYFMRPAPTVLTAYSATAIGEAGAIAAGRGATLVPPEVVPVCTLTATPQTINLGEAAKLFMACSPEARTYDLVSGQPCDAGLGCPWFKPTATTTYQMVGVSASGLRSAVQSVTVTVIQPPPLPPDPVTGWPPFPWTVTGIVYRNMTEWAAGVASGRFGASCVKVNDIEVRPGFGPCVPGTAP